MQIGIIGLGYVGLPLAVAFAEAGCDVVGLDVDAGKVEALNAGRSYIEDVPDATLEPLAGKLRATGEYTELAGCDAVILCVPTPLSDSREPDLTYLVESATALAAVLRSGQLVVLESTTYPGTTRDRLLPILETSGLTAGSDFHLAFSPERIDPGRTDFTVKTTPKLVGGVTEASTERARELYAEFSELAGKVNQAQPGFCVERIERALNNVRKPVNGSRVLILGVSYKGGVGDIRESPALKIIGRLQDFGAEVSYHDSFVPELPGHGLASVELEPALGDCDIAAIVTAHPDVDYERVVAATPLTIDFRGVTKGIEAEGLVRL